MSICLKLYILNEPADLAGTLVMCRDELRIPQDYRIYGQLEDFSRYRDDDSKIPHKPTIRVTPIPPQLWIEHNGENGSERTREDRTEQLLTFVYAEQLKRLMLPDNVDRRMRAIKAFINALSDNTPIILYWF